MSDESLTRRTGRYKSLREKANHVKRLDKMRTASVLRRKAFERMGFPEVILEDTNQYLKTLRGHEKRLKREVGSFLKGSVFEPWIQNSAGISFNGIGLITGLLPPAEEMTGVRATRKYLGLHVADDGQAPRLESGKFGYDGQLKAFAIHRVGSRAVVTGCQACGQALKHHTGDHPARPGEGSCGEEGCEKCAQACSGFTPAFYRGVYEERRVYTLTDAHPPLQPEGECKGCDQARELTQKLRSKKRQQKERESVALDCSQVCLNCGGQTIWKGHQSLSFCTCGQRERGTHWTPGHRQADALRVVAQEIFKDWWRVGNGMKAWSVLTEEEARQERIRLGLEKAEAA